MSLADWIRRHRERLGLTQGKLASKLNVSMTRVSWWEMDATQPSPSELAKLLDVFGLHSDALPRGTAIPSVGNSTPTRGPSRPKPATDRARPTREQPGAKGRPGPVLLRYQSGARDFSGEDHCEEVAREGNLEGARLVKCDFTSADFEGTKLTSTNFDGARLMDACLTDADLSHASLRRSTLRCASLERAILESADFSGAHLDNANMRDADLTRALLVGAQLRGADLRGANLRGANLTGARLVGAKLAKAVISDATVLPAAFDSTKRGLLHESAGGVAAPTAQPRRTPARVGGIAAPAAQARKTPARVTVSYPPWWAPGMRTCDRCAVPLVRKHQMGQEIVCTACFLHDRGSHLTGDVRGALALMAEEDICAYCGEPSAASEDVAGGRHGGVLSVTLCKECRELSRGREFSDFVDKLAFLKQALLTRYAHVARAREWDADELAELGPSLRLSAELREQARRIVQGRLQFDFTKFIGV
jgi:uncharacterized protein YjbI with pentapeptide repeats/transcriptional regulator with XRE-family HTH domain